MSAAATAALLHPAFTPPEHIAGRMQISKVSSSDAPRSAVAYPGGLRAATTALNDHSGAVGLDQQLGAYHALADRYTQAGHGERLSLAPALTDSLFAKTVQTALNTFTRAAWAGTDAVPPEPQKKALEAFDGLSKTGQAIVASLQVGIPDSKGPSSAAEYRARLLADLNDVQAPQASPRDIVTLSAEAQNRLAGGPTPQAPATSQPSPQMAAAINAYDKAAG